MSKKFFSLNRTFGDFFFGRGNVTLMTTDPSSKKDGGVIKIEKIHGYRKFGDKLDELAGNERKRLNILYHENTVLQ